MELIDRTALLEKSYFRGRPATVDHPWGDGAEVVDVEDIEAASVIEAAPVIHGRWEDEYGGAFSNPRYRCSVCKEKALYRHEQNILGGWEDVQALTDYCPHCGAKMDLKE